MSLRFKDHSDFGGPAVSRLQPASFGGRIWRFTVLPGERFKRPDEDRSESDAVSRQRRIALAL